MAATAGTVLVLFNSAIFTTDVIAFSSEIIRMTGRTIDCISSRWCIARVGIWQRTAYRGPMTAITARVASVVARVAAIWIMAEAGWCPAIGGMADITLFRSTQMA